jgi:hypothetical protein
VGRNYRDHAKELGNEVPAEPLLFFKPPSSLLKPGGVVRMPAASSRVDFEGELALVIGKRVTQVQAGCGLALRHPRLHAGQRRDRPRPAKERRPMDARQGLRYLLPGRPFRQRRTRSRGRPDISPGGIMPQNLLEQLRKYTVVVPTPATLRRWRSFAPRMPPPTLR